MATNDHFMTPVSSAHENKLQLSEGQLTSAPGSAWLTHNGHLLLEDGQYQVRKIFKYVQYTNITMITIVIAAFIIVPLRRILCGPNNNWEAGGTDMPNMHKGDNDGDGDE